MADTLPEYTELNENTLSRLESGGIWVPYIMNGKKYAFVVYEKGKILPKEKQNDGWHNFNAKYFDVNNFSSMLSVLNTIIKEKFKGKKEHVFDEKIAEKVYRVHFGKQNIKQKTQLSTELLNDTLKIPKGNDNEKFCLLDSGGVNIPFMHNGKMFSWIVYGKKGKLLLKESYLKKGSIQNKWITGRGREISNEYHTYDEFKDHIMKWTNKKFKNNNIIIDTSWLASTFKYFYKEKNTTEIEHTITQNPKLERKNSNEGFYILDSGGINIPVTHNRTIVLYGKYNGILFMKKTNNKWNRKEKVSFPNEYQNFDTFYKDLKNIVFVNNNGIDERQFKKYIKVSFEHFQNIGKLRRLKKQEKIEAGPTNPGEITIIGNKPFSKAYKNEYMGGFLSRFGLRGDSYAGLFIAMNRKKLGKNNWLIEGEQYELPIFIDKINKNSSLSHVLNKMKISQIFINKIFNYNKKYNTVFKNIKNSNVIQAGTNILIPRWETGFYQSIDLTKISGEEGGRTITVKDVIGKEPEKLEDFKDNENSAKILEMTNSRATVLYFNDDNQYSLEFEKKLDNTLLLKIKNQSIEINVSGVNDYLDTLGKILNTHFGEERENIYSIASEIYTSLFPLLLDVENNRVELKDSMYRGNFKKRVKPFMKFSTKNGYAYPIIKTLKGAKKYEKSGYLKKYTPSDFNKFPVGLRGIGHISQVKDEYLFLTKMTFDTIGRISTEIQRTIHKDTKIRSMFRPKKYNDGIKGASDESPHQSGNAFDIGFGYTQKDKNKIYQILKKYDTEGFILLTKESDHFHITVTDPEVRNKYDTYTKLLTQNKIERKNYKKRASLFTKEDLISQMEPSVLLDGEADRKTFKLGEYLKLQGLPETSKKILKDLISKYINVSKNQLPPDNILEKRMNIMIQFLLNIESSDGKLNVWNSEGSSAKGPFQFMDGYDAEGNITKINIAKKGKKPKWVDSHNRKKGKFSSFDTALRRYIVYETDYSKGFLDTSDERIPKHILIAYKNPGVISPIDFSAEQSINLWLVDVFQNKHSSGVLKKLLIEGKPEFMKKLYIDHHHKGKKLKNGTLESKQTIDKIHNVFPRYKKYFS